MSKAEIGINSIWQESRHEMIWIFSMFMLEKVEKKEWIIIKRTVLGKV